MLPLILYLHLLCTWGSWVIIGHHTEGINNWSQHIEIIRTKQTGLVTKYKEI